MHFPLEPLAITAFGGGGPGAKGSRRQKAGVVHAQGRENVAVGGCSERLTAELFYEPAQDDEVHVGIDKPLTTLGDRREVADPQPCFF